MKTTIYSVIESHEAEVHHNWLFTDKEKALAKVEQVRSEWVTDSEKEGKDRPRSMEIRPYDIEYPTTFGIQYNGKTGYWYMYGKYEYGSVEMMECDLDGDDFSVASKWIRVTARTRDGHILQDNFHESHWTSTSATEWLMRRCWADKDIAEITIEEFTTMKNMND